ncbi:unnamed protein product [Pleuronectes platessa]|uniref:Uncharacterized protein n=1 Tax=Pleuronectes platessa TaxID=8262 RepID=A0A9N7TQD1_PLEPL|nr:unnamed protein product [Pleuronectes platessa]
MSSSPLHPRPPPPSSTLRRSSSPSSRPGASASPERMHAVTTTTTTNTRGVESNPNLHICTCACPPLIQSSQAVRQVQQLLIAFLPVSPSLGFSHPPSLYLTPPPPRPSVLSVHALHIHGMTGFLGFSCFLLPPCGENALYLCEEHFEPTTYGVRTFW